MAVAVVLGAAAAQGTANTRYLFYLHGYIVHAGDRRPTSPEYGVYEYDKIVDTFKQRGFQVVSEPRKQDRELEPYARKVAGQVNDLLKKGIAARNITIVGASQGSWMTMLASTYINNKDINVVIIAGCSADPSFLKQIDLHGNVLSIYEKSDVAKTCEAYRKDATGISEYKEVELNTGLRHGFIYRPMKEWVEPTIAWAMR